MRLTREKISQTPDLRVHLYNIGHVVLVQHWVRPEFHALERHGPIGPDKVIDALRPLDHVEGVRGQHLAVGALWTLELLARGHLDGTLTGHVGDEEVHGNVLAVHVVIDPLSDVTRHVVGVQVTVIL